MRVRRSGASPNHRDFGVPSPQPLSRRKRGLKPTAAKVKPCESPGRAGVSLSEMKYQRSAPLSAVCNASVLDGDALALDSPTDNVKNDIR